MKRVFAIMLIALATVLPARPAAACDEWEECPPPVVCPEWDEYCVPSRTHVYVPLVDER